MRIVRRRRVGSDRLAVCGVWFAARARTAAGRSGVIRDRGCRRSVAVPRLAARCRGGVARGADDGPHRSQRVASSRSSRADCRAARSRTAGRRSPSRGCGRKAFARSSSIRRVMRGRRSRRTPLVRGSDCVCSCLRTRRPRSCFRRGRMVRLSSPCRVRGPRRARQPVRRSKGRARPRIWLASVAAGFPGRDGDVRIRGLRAARRPGAGRRRRAARWRDIAARRRSRVRPADGSGADRPHATPRRRPERRVRASGPGIPRGRTRRDPGHAGPTIAEGIRIDRPPRSRQILAAIRATGGEIVEVTDDEIRASLRTLLSRGIFVEPTSAAAHAGLARSGVARGATGTVVLAMTGHGLKSTGAIGEILGT